MKPNGRMLRASALRPSPGKARPLVRALLAVSVAAAGLAVGLWPTGEEAEARVAADPLDGHFKRPFPIYPNSRPMPIGREVIANGQPMALAQYESKDGAEQVAGYYENAWHHQGLPVVVQPLNGGKSVSCFDLATGVHQVATAVERGGRTVVFLAETTHEMSKPREPSREGPLPVPNDAWALGEVRVTGPNGHRALTFFASGEPAGVATYYRDAMIARGWKLMSREPKPGDEQAAVEFSKGGSRVVVSLMGLEEAGATSVEVTQFGALE